MLDQFTGTVFNIPTGGNTQGMNVQNFMKTMGANQNTTEFKQIKGAEGLLQTGVDATGAYFDALERANSFGMEMAAKNIDVFRPDSRNPQSLVAAKHMQELMRGVQQQGNGLKVGQAMATEYAKQRLQPDIAQRGPMIDRSGGQFTGPTTAEDLNTLVNMSPVVKESNLMAKALDTKAKSYNTKAERDYINLDLEERLAKFDDLAQKFIAAGFPEDQVRLIIESDKNSVGKASYDPLEGEKLGIRKSELELKRARTKAQNAKDYADVKKAKKGERTAEDMLDRMVALNENREGAFKMERGKVGPGDPGSVGVDDMFRDWELGKGSQTKENDKKVVRGIVHREGRAFAVIVQKNKLSEDNDPLSNVGVDPESIVPDKVTELRPLDIDLVRDLYTQNSKEDEFNDFIQMAEDKNMIDKNGNLIFESQGFEQNQTGVNNPNRSETRRGISPTTTNTAESNSPNSKIEIANKKISQSYGGNWKSKFLENQKRIKVLREKAGHSSKIANWHLNFSGNIDSKIAKLTKSEYEELKSIVGLNRAMFKEMGEDYTIMAELVGNKTTTKKSTGSFWDK